MKKHTISFAKAGFSSLVTDYLFNHPSLQSFYQYPPSLDSFKQVIAAKAQHPINRELLVQVLLEQSSVSNSQFNNSTIQQLHKQNTFTVTTGHQLNLFTGPLYFIYKIITTITLALELKIAFPDKNFVPVYWMATEDHDFEEINHVNVDEKDISWIQQTNGATG